MDQDNSGQRDFWAGPSGQSWITEETRQDTLLASVADRVEALAGFDQGMRVIDIGSGTGALSIKAAEAVGADGHVLAVDISEPLIARSSERLRPYAHAGTRLGDAATADWGAAEFDIAVSRFGVMFFADPPAAFANIARAVKPGGRIVFAAWGPVGHNPFWSLPSAIATERLGHVPGTEPDLPGPMGLATPGLAADRLRAAGLVDVEVLEEDVQLSYPGTTTDLAELIVMVGPARRIINATGGTVEDVDAIRTSLAAAFHDVVVDQGGDIALPARINFLMGATPSV